MDDQALSPPLLSDGAADKDLLDFEPYTQTLLDIIRDPNTQGPLAIGLFGTWGAGKTSLMKFVQADLADAEKNGGRRFRLVWFDAWKYEKEDALWRALLLRVIDNLRDRDGDKDVTPEPLKGEIARLEQRLYRDVEWVEKGGLTIEWAKLVKSATTGAVKLSFALVPGLSTLTEAVKAAQGALGKAEGADNLLDAFRRDVIEHHQTQLRSLEQFQREFEELVARRIVAQGERLVVFVDDLDRCLPEKAIEVLEAIKLFLDVKGCIFLLGLDQTVITRGIKVKYREFAVDEGEGSEKRIPIDGAQYLEKIVQLPFRLPKIEPRAMQPFISQLAAFPDARCADVFAEGLETNPRKVKRAINIFLFISKLAERRRIPVQPVRLGKVVVIYHSHLELYDLLRLKPALLRDLEVYLRKQAAATPREPERGLKLEGGEIAERAAKETESPPVPARLLTDSLKRVLTLFLEDEHACFLNAEYAELDSYFTLTRGAIAEAPVAGAAEAAARAALAFPIPMFVRVPAGEFPMGTSDADIEQLLKMEETKGWAKEWKEKGWFKSEQPRHRVTLGAFEIGKYPVTNAEYLAFVQAGKHRAPSHWSGETFPEELAAHPVVNVSWEDAAAYCEWLTRQLYEASQLREGEVIRLPTEAEWEKAASWDDEKKVKRFWPWGDQWDTAKCNTAEGRAGKTTPVGKYSPSGDSFYGAADMAGNVWEWCSDWWDEKEYEKRIGQELRNPADPPSGNAKVVRGGAWLNDRGFCRAAVRFGLHPSGFGDDLGFRVVRAPVRP